MNRDIAKRFATEVRRVFPDAKSDSLEGPDEYWVAPGALYNPERDVRIDPAYGLRPIQPYNRKKKSG